MKSAVRKELNQNQHSTTHFLTQAEMDAFDRFQKYIMQVNKVYETDFDALQNHFNKRFEHEGNICCFSFINFTMV